MYRAISCFIPAIVSVALAGCSGDRQLPSARDLTPQRAAPHALPRPSTLADDLSPVRGTSYTADDLHQNGYEYSTTLPRQRVGQSGFDAIYGPAWSDGATDLSGLAYAMYDFTIEGYGGSGLVSYSLGAPPTPFENIYIGLANWDTDAWQWFPAEADGLLELPSIDPYLAFGGKLLVCITAVGSVPVQLDSLRIGSLPPHVLLSADATQGVTPWTVTLDASASTDPDGSVVEYRWDIEPSGNFNTTTGGDPTWTVTQMDPIAITVYVRAVDDTGIYDTASIDVRARAAETFTYGSPEGNENVRATTIDLQGDLVMWGNRTVAGNAAVMRMEQDSAGAIDVATWDAAGTDLLFDACDDLYGGAWTCGSTDSFGQGGNDGLIQHWDKDGALTASWAIGLADTDQEFTAIAADADAVYVSCNQFDSVAVLYTAYVVRVGPVVGQVQWCRQYKSAQSVSLDDMVLANGVLRTCGSYTPTAGDLDALYMGVIAVDGSTSGRSFLGNTTDDERATSVLLGDEGMPGIWIAGTIGTSGVDHSFIATPQGTVVEVVADFSLQLNAARLVQLPRAPLTLVLSRRETFVLNSIVVADFDNTLAVMPTSEEFSASPGGQAYPLGAVPYGGNGLLVTGSNIGALPVPVAPGINAVPTSRPWHSVPLEIQDQTMQTVPTDLDLESAVPGFDRNRASDNDALIILREHNALPPS